MATFPFDEPINGCIGVRIFARWLPTGSVGMLTPNIGFGGTPTITETEAVLETVAGFLSDSLQAQTFDQWRFFRAQAFSREDPAGPISDMTLGITGAMAATSGYPFQSNWAPLVLLGSGAMGYGNHGRIYNLAPAPQLVLTSGFNTGYMDALVETWGLFKTLIEDLGMGMQLGIARKSQGNVVAARNITYSTKLTEQSRRRPNFGE